MQILSLSLDLKNELTATNRDQAGFGSTGKTKIDLPQPPLQPVNINNMQQHTTAAAATTIAPTTTPEDDLYVISKDDDDIYDILPCCNIELSTYPFLNSKTIELTTKGNHPTQGLELLQMDEWENRILITGCKAGTAPRNVRNWIKRIKHSFLLKVNNIDITTVEQATEIIRKATLMQEPTISITVSPHEKASIHHEEGVPMLYFDQLATIADHLNNIKYATTSSAIPTTTQLDQSDQECNRYINKMITAFKQFGSINAAKAILLKNK